jgi:hypothetical protein
VSDQGTASPFTALMLIGEYARAGSCQRALLVVADQAVVPFALPPGTAVPERDTAVALSLGPVGRARIVALRQHPAVAPSDVDDIVAAELASLPPAPGPIAVLGPDDRPAGLVGTAPWWALADALDRPGPHRTVLVDHEASLGYLSLLAIDTE